MEKALILLCEFFLQSVNSSKCIVIHCFLVCSLLTRWCSSFSSSACVTWYNGGIIFSDPLNASSCDSTSLSCMFSWCNWSYCTKFPQNFVMSYVITQYSSLVPWSLSLHPQSLLFFLHLVWEVFRVLLCPVTPCFPFKGLQQLCLTTIPLLPQASLD